MCLFFSDWPGLRCIILNVALGKKSLDTPALNTSICIWANSYFLKGSGYSYGPITFVSLVYFVTSSCSGKLGRA